jgi:hypothetical protein
MLGHLEALRHSPRLTWQELLLAKGLLGGLDWVSSYLQPGIQPGVCVVVTGSDDEHAACLAIGKHVHVQLYKSMGLRVRASPQVLWVPGPLIQ